MQLIKRFSIAISIFYGLKRSIEGTAISQFNISGIMIKNGFIALLLTFCVGSFSFSQDLQHADKIIEIYGQEWYDLRRTENSDLLILMDKYVEHGFSVRTVSEGKYEQEQEPIEMIPLTSKTESYITVQQFMQEVESPNFNPLRYAFFSTKEAQVYKLKGVNKIIYIIPQESILLK